MSGLNQSFHNQIMHDFLIVGAGFSGSVLARQLADKGKKVLLIDRRSHVGGNAYDTTDDNGVLIHPYGPHIFHTNSKAVIEFLSRFTDWRFYEHRVLAVVNGKKYPLPINKTTVNQLYNLELDEQGVEKYYESVREPKSEIKSSEDVVLNSVGHDLCEKFFRGYTRKQWGMDLSELSAGVAARIPTRTNDDDRYFTDTYQLMPSAGYTRMFERIIDSPLIELRLNTVFKDIKAQLPEVKIIFTGPIDEYYDFCFGSLPYRSLEFKHRHISDVDQYQEVGTVNYPNDFEYTRITEFKHLTGQVTDGTSIVEEYPRADGDPFYPIPTKANEIMYKKYQELAENDKNVYFVGRLAQYRYYNMDQVVAAALKAAKDILAEA